VRLYPAFWVCALATAAVRFAYPQVFPAVHPRQVLVNLTMFAEPLGAPLVDGVYWTLWVEMRFYLLFLAVVWIGLTYERAVAFCLLWSVASMMTPLMHQSWLETIVMPVWSHYFIGGIALFLMFKYGQNLVLWGIVALSWILAMFYYQGNLWQQHFGQPYWPASLLVTLSFGAMALLALGKLRWLRWRGLTVLGATTYPLYLLHDVIGQSAIHLLYPRLGLPPAVLVTAVLAVLVLAAWLVHRLIERPLAPRLKRALSRPPRERRVPTQAPPPVAPALDGDGDAARQDRVMQFESRELDLAGNIKDHRPRHGLAGGE
jgi:peptidoglycan/LPS O-acetylase OafA/YrhL